MSKTKGSPAIVQEQHIGSVVAIDDVNREVDLGGELPSIGPTDLNAPRRRALPTSFRCIDNVDT
jgi:hypothetical protein